MNYLNIYVDEQQAIDPELNITLAGNYEVVSDHTVDRSGAFIITESVIIFCYHGSGWLTFGNNREQVTQGMAIFCDMNTSYAYESDINNPWSLYWFHIDGTLSEQLASKLNSVGRACTFKTYNEKELYIILRIILAHLNQSNQLNHYQIAKHYLKGALLQQLNEQQTNNKTQNSELDPITIVSNYMMEHINENISLEALCTQANLSKYYFIRFFKNHVGCSPIAYFQKLKIQEACNRLKSSSQSIREISDSLGYNNQYHFSSTFKKEMNISPRTYRKIMRHKY